MDTHPQVATILKQFEDSIQAFSENKILDSLNALASELRRRDDKIPDSLRAEALAFHLVENSLEKETPWGNYYGPQFIGENEAGERVDIPSFSSITPEIIEYW